jgi:pyruvate carboxylase subunit A
MKRALKEFTIRPLKTTIPLYLKIMDDPAFGHGDFDTGYIQRFIPDPAGDP